ncbi:hypothetical protein K466DRAFT_393138 [Polyporus arcularius HHB13444]|uniref:Uncharacterized protein n=1 Tax=Polyporus arcularius HHB13444 TaxID=1314778 RepID=A0A5C3PMW8_9APHY|nr:hypothetical protein K466DRAFT_393138 [Polyporus arcularius HHB13444]
MTAVQRPHARLTSALRQCARHTINPPLISRSRLPWGADACSSPPLRLGGLLVYDIGGSALRATHSHDGPPLRSGARPACPASEHEGADLLAGGQSRRAFLSAPIAVHCVHAAPLVPICERSAVRDAISPARLRRMCDSSPTSGCGRSRSGGGVPPPATELPEYGLGAAITISV